MNSRCNNMDNSGIDVSLCVARLYVFARLLRNKNKFRPPGAKSVLGSANALFPEQITTGRTTTSAVFKGVSTLDSINFGAFEL